MTSPNYRRIGIRSVVHMARVCHSIVCHRYRELYHYVAVHCYLKVMFEVLNEFNVFYLFLAPSLSLSHTNIHNESGSVQVGTRTRKKGQNIKCSTIAAFVAHLFLQIVGGAHCVRFHCFDCVDWFVGAIGVAVVVATVVVVSSRCLRRLICHRLTGCVRLHDPNRLNSKSHSIRYEFAMILFGA